MALFAAIAVFALPAMARDSDRNQPMDIDAGRQEGTLDGNSVNVLSGGVTITQGTLDIRADRADIHQRGGEVVRAVLTGSQAVLKQQMDDGSPMTAKADRIDYDMTSEVILLTGNYTVTTPRGTTSGQRLTYNLKSGRIESGGEGNGRVTMRIQPKSAQKAPQNKPAAAEKP
jgi:lipopolysaccharide export system protein LptA